MPKICFDLQIFDLLLAPAFDQEALVPKLLLAPFLLALPISAAYLQWLLRPRPVPWIWRTGYTLAVLMGLALLAGYGWGVFLAYSGNTGFDVEQLIVSASCAFAALGAGAWLVMRNRRVGIPHALNALIALQVVYVSGALAIVVGLTPIKTLWGALFIVLTVVVYAAQMVLGSRRKGRTEPLRTGGGTPQH